MLTIEVDEFFDGVKAGNLAKVNELIDRDPALLNAKNKTGATGILFALYNDHPAVAELIAQRKHDLNVFEAASLGKLARLEALTKQNPGLVRTFSEEGFTALQLAAYLGQRETVDSLLKAGAEVNAVAKNPTGYTALSGAVSRGHRDIAETLLAKGADPNHRYEGGFTPLMEAAASGNLEITRLLLAHGADPQIKMGGKTAHDYALEKGHEEAAALLKEHKTDVRP